MRVIDSSKEVLWVRRTLVPSPTRRVRENLVGSSPSSQDVALPKTGRRRKDPVLSLSSLVILLLHANETLGVQHEAGQN